MSGIRHRTHMICSAAFVFAVSAAVWSTALKGAFVYDDHHMVVSNVRLSGVGYIPELFISSTAFLGQGMEVSNTYRPLVFLIFMAERGLFGLNPTAFHLVNVILHSINSVLVFFMASFIFYEDDGNRASGPEAGAKMVLSRLLPPVLAGLVFALHTINSEPVNWVSAMTELGYAFFVLISLYLYLRASKRFTELTALKAASAAFFFLGLLCKETAIVLPAVIIAHDLLTRGKGFIKGYKPYILYIVAAAAYMAVRTFAVGGLMRKKQIILSAYEATINVFPLITHYISKLILPVGLNVLYEFHVYRSITEARVLAGIVIAFGFIAVLMITRRKKALTLGLLLIALPVLPVLYIPALSTAAAADRYLYLPAAGFAVMLASIINASFRGSKTPVIILASICALALLAAYSAGSVRRSAVWKDDFTLWTDTVAKSPRSSTAHYNLAWASQARGDVKGAAGHYREAITLEPGAADAHYNLGVIYMDGFMLDEAAFEFKEALRINPDYSEARERLKELHLLASE